MFTLQYRQILASKIDGLPRTIVHITSRSGFRVTILKPGAWSARIKLDATLTSISAEDVPEYNKLLAFARNLASRL